MSFLLFKKLRRSHKGFGLLELILAIGIFVVYAIGIYSGIQWVFKAVFNSRVRIIETAVLNEQIEIIRNLSFFDVGITSGSPAGILEKTVTTTRNGLDLQITRTIRNIDDPFDGQIGGDPNDTAPADYKEVQVEVLCTNCNQQVPQRMSTIVAPKFLEGDPTHGALFIEVFDASADPVQGATVTILATSTDPQIDLTDTTDNDGMLKFVDLGEGVAAYHITITKNGYTTDGTMVSTPEVQNPIRTPASVVAQDVSEVSFSIDLAASMTVSTTDAVCDAIGSATVGIQGTKLIGTNPDVLTVNTAFVTDGSGIAALNNYIWDTYTFFPQSYSLIGTIPAPPIVLSPGVDQPVHLLLGPSETYSMLVSVIDSTTGQPISNATTTVTTTIETYQATTGLGHVRQTDWSGGSGQETFINADEYWTDDGNVEVLASPGNMTLRQVGQNYVTDAELESSTFDLGVAATYGNLVWEPLAQPIEVGSNGLRFQIASVTNTTSSPTWDYRGPDGTAASYYDENNTVIHDSHNGDRFFRYKVFMHTDSTTNTPTLSDISIGYTNGCTPPGQTFFSDVTNQTYTVTVEADGYGPFLSSVEVDGNELVIAEMVSE